MMEKQFHNHCIFGNIIEIKNTDLSQYNRDFLNEEIKILEDKILEIETWKYEPENEHQNLHFKYRQDRIFQCIEIIKKYLSIQH